MEKWTVTTDTRLAAAFGTLGTPVRISGVLDTGTNTDRIRFFLGLVNTDGDCRTKKLLAALKKGELEAATPAHPLLTMLRTHKNRLLLLDCANKGARIRLIRVPGTEVYQYVEGDTGLPGVAGHRDLIKTPDLKMAAALGIVGLPVLMIEGSEGSRMFWLPRYGPTRKGLGRVDGQHLMRLWRTDKKTVPWADPFAQAARYLYNRERLLDAINRNPSKLLLRKPKSVKAAYIQPHASKEAFDIVRNFFNG
jgi:hypothetical protein